MATTKHNVLLTRPPSIQQVPGLPLQSGPAMSYQSGAWERSGRGESTGHGDANTMCVCVCCEGFSPRSNLFHSTIATPGQVDLARTALCLKMWQDSHERITPSKPHIQKRLVAAVSKLGLQPIRCQHNPSKVSVHKYVVRPAIACKMP